LDGRDDAIVAEDELAVSVVDVMVRLLIPAAAAAAATVGDDDAATLKQVNGPVVAVAVCGWKRCHRRDEESRQERIEMGSLLGSSFSLSCTPSAGHVLACKSVTVNEGGLNEVQIVGEASRGSSAAT
jgi:hypothetical protein